MVYEYQISYDQDKDDFLGLVYNPQIDGNDSIFTIDDTKEICDYIKTGVMSHIDDVKGLEVFLKQQNYLLIDDVLVLCKEVLY